jgi:site-specific DNA recombinase
MKAVIYSRKSKFTGKGESVENQLQLCKEYCQRENLELFDYYEDEGFSAKNIDRPEFRRMLTDAKKKNFDLIVCYRLDRISRNIADFATLIEDLNRLGIGFISVNERFDTSSPLGRAMMNIAAVFAQLERETIAERIRDNMLQLSRTGRWLGGKPPTGYKSEPVLYTDAKGKEKKMQKLVPVDEELELVKLLYEKYIELNGIHKLEGYCFKNNITSKSGNFFDKSSLMFILNNPVYAIAEPILWEYCKFKNMDVACEKEDFDGHHGLMVYNKRKLKGKGKVLKEKAEWVVSVGLHPGVISAKDWILVQNMLEENSSKAPRDGTSSIALLTPLIKCGNCGTSLRISYRMYNGEIRHHYYKCRLKERSRGTQCNTANLLGRDADQLVIDEIKKIALNQNAILEKLSSKQNTLKQSFKQIDNKKEKLSNQIREFEKLIENLIIQLAQNASSVASTYIIKQIEDFDKKLIESKRQLENLDEQTEETLLQQINIATLEQQLNYFSSSVDSLPFEEKKKLLRSIVESIVWDGDMLYIKIFEVD